MHPKLLLLYLLFVAAGLNAQTYPISTQQPTGSAFLHLLETNQALAANDSLNEVVVDLVQPLLVDSLIENKNQHHKVGGLGHIASLFGFKWRAYSLTKQKIVGTVVYQTRSSKERYTEYDVNFVLQVHQPHYLQQLFGMYDAQLERKRQDHRGKDYHTDYTTSPFVRDTLITEHYTIKCELTPEADFRDSLHANFYPTLRDGGNLSTHPNFETPHPTMGFYGTLCLDCNHSCHPELHPYEWMWWLKCTENDTTTAKQWYIGLFHEGSNRLKKWSQNPMTGTVQIPFAFNATTPHNIEIEHLVVNEFDTTALNQLTLPAQPCNATQNQTLSIAMPNDTLLNIELTFSETLNNAALQYWLENLNYDSATGIISGYFCYAVSAIDVYACRVVFR